MNAKVSGIFWSRLTDEVIAKVSKWDVLILNEANINKNGDQPEADLAIGKIRALNPNIKIGISFNGLCLFGDNTKTAGNVYWPVQQLIWQAADETNAWLRDANGAKMSTVSPTASVQNVMFDLRVPAFRYRLADILNDALDSYGADFYHIDELHRTLGFLKTKYPVGLPTEAEWTAANKSLIRMIDWPVMGNGNYDVTLHHKTKSRGRYIQNAVNIGDTTIALTNDLDIPKKYRWTIVNPVGTINKVDWAKFSYGTGVGIQRWVGANSYSNPDLETLTF